jgi:hypothetical protein
VERFNGVSRCTIAASQVIAKADLRVPVAGLGAAPQPTDGVGGFPLSLQLLRNNVNRPLIAVLGGALPPHPGLGIAPQALKYLRKLGFRMCAAGRCDCLGCCKIAAPSGLAQLFL